MMIRPNLTATLHPYDMRAIRDEIAGVLQDLQYNAYVEDEQIAMDITGALDQIEAVLGGDW